MGTASVVGTTGGILAGLDRTRSPKGRAGTEKVLTPDVMMTDWKRSKTGLMASEASMQLWEADKGGEGQARGLRPHSPFIPLLGLGLT